MSTPLQQAIECLTIRDVVVRKTHAFIADEYEPKYDPAVDNLDVQLLHIVRLGRVLEIEDGDQKRQIFQVYIDLGARWVRPVEVVDGKGDAESADPPVLAQVEATFVSEYELTKELGKEALDAFALKNASFHVWPYWREYLSTQCMRMGLPKIMVPTVQFASNREQQGALSSCDEGKPTEESD
ncbi:MAG: preprotein translocase subunit SecB [Thiobacillus sp.]|nr:preprotein translocase subunit SecB [Thiobacillus sp.]